MQPLCQISKKLYGKSTIFNNLRTAFSHKSHTVTRQIVQSTKVINSIINLHLPLLIFVGMHSQDSHFHKKCLFCSITSIFMSKYLCSRVQFTNPKAQCASAKSRRKVKSSIRVCRNMSNYVYNLSLGYFYNKSSIIFQPDNSVFITEEKEGT